MKNYRHFDYVSSYPSRNSLTLNKPLKNCAGFEPRTLAPVVNEFAFIDETARSVLTFLRRTYRVYKYEMRISDNMCTESAVIRLCKRVFLFIIMGSPDLRKDRIGQGYQKNKERVQELKVFVEKGKISLGD